MTHIPASCDLLHDSRDDVSDAITPTAMQLEVIALLELNPAGHRLVRLTRRDRQHVDAIVAALAAARSCAPVPIPPPRPALSASPAQSSRRNLS